MAWLLLGTHLKMWVGRSPQVCVGSKLEPQAFKGTYPLLVMLSVPGNHFMPLIMRFHKEVSVSVLTKLCQLHFSTFAILKLLHSNSKYSSCSLIWVIISNTLLFRWLVLFYPTCAKGRLRYWSHHSFETDIMSVFLYLLQSFLCCLHAGNVVLSLTCHLVQVCCQLLRSQLMLQLRLFTRLFSLKTLLCVIEFMQDI